jgi:hypothetical protein
MTRVGPTNDTRPPEEKFGQKMLEEITASEQMLGRVLAPARIIRIQWVGAGERYELQWTVAPRRTSRVMAAHGVMVVHDSRMSPAGSGMARRWSMKWME